MDDVVTCAMNMFNVTKVCASSTSLARLRPSGSSSKTKIRHAAMDSVALDGLCHNTLIGHLVSVEHSSSFFYKYHRIRSLRASILLYLQYMHKNCDHKWSQSPFIQSDFGLTCGSLRQVPQINPVSSCSICLAVFHATWHPRCYPALILFIGDQIFRISPIYVLRSLMSSS